MYNTYISYVVTVKCVCGHPVRTLSLSTASSRLEEARKKREERKLQRQKELEARRANKLTGGPMKLGTKKM